MKQIIMAVAAVSLSAAFAETYHWTGAAGDSGGVYQWNNSANWDQGSRGSGTHAVPDAGATVVFGAVAGDPESMVLDLTDMAPVGQFRIEGETAPAYQFGTGVGTSQTADGGQSFWLGPACVLTIAEEVARDQKIMRLAYDPVAAATVALTNNSTTASFVYETISRSSNSQTYTFSFAGAGRFVTHTNQFHTTGGQYMYFRGTGPIVWRNTMVSSGSSVSRPLIVYETGSAPRDFEIAQGGKLYASNGSSPFTGNFDVKVDTWVHGEGIIAANTHGNSKTGNGNEAIRGMGLLVSGSNGKTLTVDVPLMPWNTHQAQNKWWDGYIPLIGCAKSVISLNSSNGCSRASRIYGQVRVNAKRIGNADCTAEETSLGPGEIVMSAYFDVSNSKFRLYYPLGCTLAYSGETATETDRDILLTNAIYEVTASSFTSLANSSVATGTVANAGGGLLKLTGQVRALNPDAALVLQAETAPIEFAGSFAAAPAVSLVVCGAEEVRMASVPANAGALSLMGGTLRLTGETSATFVPLSAYGDGNRIVVDGSSLTLTGTTPAALVANGAVDFTFERSTVVTFAGVTSATEVPENLTVNGVGAIFTDDGRLTERASYWKTATDGTWESAENWEPAIVPTGNRDACIEVDGANYTVSVDETPTALDFIHLGQGDTGYTSTLAIAAAMPGGVKYDVGAGGVLNVTDGGILTLEDQGASVDLSRGGTLRVDGTGRCLYDDTKVNTFGTGMRQFVGDGALVRLGTATPTVYVQPDAAGETSELVLDNRGSGSAGSTNDFGNGTLYVGNCADGTGVLTVHGKDDTNKAVNRVSLDRGDPYELHIGFRAGSGVLNIDGGCIQVRNNGFYMPGVAYTDKTPTVVSGVANQSGGYVSLIAYSAGANRRLTGLSVGCGDYFYLKYVSADQVSVDGVYNLSGGTLDVGIGYAVIGAGSGTGVVHQTGGTFLHRGTATSSSYTNQLFAAEPDAKKARTFHFPMIIGLQGGKGTYEISGGTATVGSKTALIPALYIGTGYNHEEFPWGFKGTSDCKPSDYYFDFERDGAEGLLRVSGGTFTCTTNVVLGAALGKGTIEMVGAAGTLSVGRLVATNGVKSVLRFVCDRENPAAGVSPITVADKAMLDGTTLEVELGENYSGRARVRLINAPQVEGDFGRVTVTGKSADSAVVVKDELGVRLQIRRGFVMVVR